MATPATGAISFADLSTEILQASSTSQRSMVSASQRLGYGATAQVSMSDLRKAYGATITSETYTDPKFGITSTGYTSDFPGLGSIDDATITGSMTLNTVINENPNETVVAFGSTATGYEGTNVNRVALGDTTKSIINGTPYTDGLSVTATMPSSGTITVGLRWNV